MEQRPTPRQMAKGLLSGIVPPRPLFLPIVFSLGAKVENVPLGAFLGNPTKISSALRQMRAHLRSDGVACYFDPYLEVEALGATLQRISDDQAPTIHWPLPARMGEMPEGLRSPEEAANGGRVPVVVEVIRRLNALPNRDFLLMAGVTGPLTLAARLTQLENKDSLRSEDLSDAVQELAASAVTQMASIFLEAGADTLIIWEEIVPALSAESCEAWANLLAPTFNVARFYEALPLLHLPCASLLHENWDLIFRRQWDCVKCAPAEVIASRRKEGSPSSDGAPFGIALPLDAFQPEGASDKSFFQDIQTWMLDLRPSVVTTAGDVPFTTNMKHLNRVLEEIPRAG
jgi:uroporphyrinogen decarboxylase-like protein